VSRGRISAIVFLVVALLGFLTGCNGDEGQVIRHYTFHGPRGTRAVDVPVHLNADLPRSVVRYSLTADVTIEPRFRDRDLDLVIPYLPAVVALRVDGEPVPTLGYDDAGMVRHVGPHRWTLGRALTARGKVAIALDVTYAWTQSAWVDVAPRLVPSGSSTPLMERTRLFNDRGGWLGLIGLSEMGFTFLALYFWDRRRRAHLWFAIQALSASYYPAYVLGWTTQLAPRLDLLFLAQSLSIAPVVSVYYTHEYFELGKPHRLWSVLLFVAILVPLPAVYPTFINSAYGTPGVVACVGAAVVYQLATGARLVKTYADRRTVLFFVCCWLALGGSSWVDLYAWMGSGEILAGARPACLGLGLFGIFQSMLLSRSHFRSMQEADRLNASLTGRLRELEQRQKEIEGLNEELRQQVGRRSAHILAALTGTGGFTAELEPGDLVEDRYRVIGALGTGGMGTVYEVERLHDRRRLALKVTRENRGIDLARLAREAQVTARVRHPNVVTVVDTDVAKAGYVYIVMDLVEGCSLAECEGQHDLAWCLGVLVQVLEGLIAIHAQGIIHRDLKPGNVLLEGDIQRNPRAKIADFGISRGPAESPPPRPATPTRKAATPQPPTVRVTAKREDSGDSTESDIATDHAIVGSALVSSTPQLTRTGAISGTPSYVAPELARTSGQITPAVDVFSFGVVAYRLFTGAQPHSEAPLLALLDGREPKLHVSLVDADPELPDAVARAVDSCLALTPDKRPTTTELLRVLFAALQDIEPANARLA
jgi:serine/threonine-protein kinase